MFSVLKIFLIIMALIFIASGLQPDPLPLDIRNGKVIFSYDDEYAGKVELGGTLNGWNPGANPLTQNEYGIWTAEVALDPGKYEYKFIIDGRWMDGDNLRFELKKNTSGELSIITPPPRSNININDKIFINGGILYQTIWNKPYNTASEWQEEKSFLKMDADLRITVSDAINGFIQFQRDENFNASVDEAHIEIKKGQILYYAGVNEYLLDFKEPGRLLDEYTDYYNDDIYFYDEDKPKYRRFGKKYVTFMVKKDSEKLPLTFFISDHKYDDDDILGFNTLMPLSDYMRCRFTGAMLKDKDGAWIKNNSNDNDAYRATDDQYNLWLSGFQTNDVHFDVLRIINPYGRNYTFKYEIDLEFNSSDKTKFYFSFLNKTRKSTYAAYIDGFYDDSDSAYNYYYNYRRYGGNIDASQITAGVITGNDSLRAGIEVNSTDMATREIGCDSSLGSFSKAVIRLNLKLRYNLKNRLNIGFNYLSYLPDVQDNVNYYYLFERYNFYHKEIEGIDNVNQFQLRIESHFDSFFNFKLHNYYNSYKISKSKISDDITTNELKFLSDFQVSSGFALFAGLRYKTYSFVNQELYSNVFPFDNYSFTDYNLGIKYTILNGKAYLMLSWGLGLFLDDEEKEVRLTNYLEQETSYNLYSNFIEQILYEEQVIEKNNYINLECKLTF